MRPFRAYLPLGIVLALCLTGFTAAAAPTPANVPTWQVGQSVGYGTNVNLTTLFDTYVRPLITTNPASLNITSINTLDFTGSFDSWTVDTVTQATSAYYVLNSQSATGLKFHLNVNLTMTGLPAAGTYTGTPSGYGFCYPPTIPTTSRTVAVRADGDILTESTSSVYQQVSNLAYMNDTTDATVQASIAVSTYGIPMTSTNSTSCVETVSYDSPSFTLTADTHDEIRMLFEPAWDYFNFPISDNKTWWANTTATVGATLSGTVNVQGLSSQDQAAFFDNLTKAFQSLGLAAQGLSSFPIDLSKVTISEGPLSLVNNGDITDVPLSLNENLRATASAQTLSDHAIHPVYLITSAAYQCPSAGSLTSLPVGYAAVYAPDFPTSGAGMIAGYQLLLCLGSTSLPGYGLTNTAPADARKNIGQTETTYAPFPPAASNALADFFTQSPYWGILLIVAVVVVVVALLVLRRRHRPGRVPPPPPSP
ncbi:MAG TPA: hypothetical protein HA326_00410 [Thermoplasmata archaeon]|nr:hypothetical protein [Thermoplasmata archaeon]